MNRYVLYMAFLLTFAELIVGNQAQGALVYSMTLSGLVRLQQTPVSYWMSI